MCGTWNVTFCVHIMNDDNPISLFIETINALPVSIDNVVIALKALHDENLFNSFPCPREGTRSILLFLLDRPHLDQTLMETFFDFVQAQEIHLDYETGHPIDHVLSHCVSSPWILRLFLSFAKDSLDDLHLLYDKISINNFLSRELRLQHILTLLQLHIQVPATGAIENAQ